MFRSNHAVFYSKDTFDLYVEKLEKAADYGETLYFIMRTGYTEKEMLKGRYTVEPLQYECYRQYEGYVWLNDWYEGQQYIDIMCVITDDDIIDMIKELNNFKIQSGGEV